MLMPLISILVPLVGGNDCGENTANLFAVMPAWFIFAPLVKVTPKL
jgi:hypothetical protein